MVRRILSFLVNSRKKRIMLGILIFLGAIIVLSSTIIHSHYFKRYLLAKANGYLETRYKLSLSTEDIHYSVLRLSAILDDVEVRPIVPESSVLQLFRAKQIIVNFPLTVIFSSKLHLQRLKIHQPHIIITQHKEDKKNINQAKDTNRGKYLLFQIDEFELDGGALNYNNKQYSLQGSLLNIFAQIQYSKNERANLGGIDAQNGEIIFSQSNLLLRDISAKFKFDSKEIYLEKFSMSSDSSTLEASGWMRDYQNTPQYNFELKGSLNLEEFHSFFDSMNGYKGNVLLEATAQKQGGQFNVAGRLKGHDLTFYNLPVAKIDASFTGTDKALSISSFDIDIAQGNLVGNLNIIFTPDLDYSLSLNWDSIDLESLTENLPSSPIILSSKSKGKLAAHWHTLNLNDIDASGEISFHSPSIISQRKEDSNTLDGQITFKVSQGEVEVQPSYLSINKNTLSFSGNLDKEKNLRTQFLLKSEDLSKTEGLLTQLKNRTEAPLLQKIPMLNAAGRFAISGTINGSLTKPRASLDLEGYDIKAHQAIAHKIQGTLSYQQKSIGFDVAIDQLLMNKEDFSRVEVGGSFKNTSLVLDRLEVFKGDGNLSGNLSIDFHKRIYSLDINGEKIELNSIKLLKNEKADLSGMLNLTFEGKGTFEHPRFSLRLSCEKLQALNAELNGVKFLADLIGETIKFSLNIPEGKTEIEGNIQLKEPYIIKGIFSTRDLQIENIMRGEEYKLLSQAASEVTAEASYTIPLKKLQDMAVILKIAEANLTYQELSIQNSRPILLMVEKGKIEIKDFHLVGSNTEFKIYGNLPLKAENEGGIQVDGDFNLKLLEPYIKDSNFTGVISLKGEIKDSLEKPHLIADIKLSQGAFSNPIFPYKATDIALDVIIEESAAKLRNFSAKVDEGIISAQGIISLSSLPINLPKQLFLSCPMEKNDIEIVFSNIDLGKLKQLIDNDLLKQFRGSADGRIQLRGSFSQISQLELEGNMSKLFFSISQLAVKNEDTIRFNLKDNIFYLNETRLSGEKSSIRIAGQIELTPQWNLDAQLLADIDSALLTPFFNNVVPGGSSEWELSVKGPITNPTITGFGEIKDGFFQLRDFPVIANNVTGRIEFSESAITIPSLKGAINGGPFNIQGKLSYHKFKVDVAEFYLSASNVQLNYPAGLLSQSNATIGIKMKGKNLLLSGDIKLLQAYYGADVYAGTQLLKAARTPQPTIRGYSEPSAFQNIQLDIKVTTVESIVIDNNMANLELQGNLSITGSMFNPILSGRVAMKNTGEIIFGENSYQVERAVIDFLGTEEIDPYLNITAHTKLRHKYDELEVKLTLSGPLSNLNYSLSSFPPRSQDDLAALLLTGHGLDEVKSDTVNIIGNQMLLHFTSPIASPVTKTLQKLFRVEEVTIEPINIATEEDPGARFTFSKRVSDDVALTYSVDVSNSQNQTWILDYDLNPNFSIRSFHKDDGSYGSSFMHRFRLGYKEFKSQKEAEIQKDRLLLKGVKIEGELIFPQDIIRKKIRILKKGSYFNYVNLNKAIENLISFYKNNGYLNAVIAPIMEYEEERNVNLALRIIPNKAVAIKYLGEPISKNLKKKISNSWNGRLPENIMLMEAKKTIINRLRSRGFYNAEVTIEKKETADKTTFIFFTTRGNRYHIGKLYIIGNQSINSNIIEKTIKELAKARNSNLWFLIYDFKPANEAIETLYEDNGFLSSAVKSPKVEVYKEKQLVDIYLSIDEGPQSWVHSIELKGNKALSDEELRSRLQLIEGKVYKPSLLPEDKNHLLNLYRAKGYQDIEIAVKVISEPDKHSFSILYTINEGVKHIIEEIKIVGNQRTAHYIILRELKFKIGDVLNLSKLSLSQKSLYDIGIFRSVNIYFQPTGAKKGQDRITIEVQEIAHYAVAYGLRYNTEVKFEGFGELSLYNIFGRGRNGLLYYRQNNREKNLRFSLKEPYLFGRKLNTIYSLYYNRELKASFITEDIGFSLQQQRDLPYNLSLSYLYKFHWIHTYELEQTGPFIFDITLFLSELSAFLLRDTRDRKMDSTTGSFFSINFSYSPKFLVSDLTYVSFFGQYSFYKAISSNVIWASNVRVGLADAFDQILIPSERFYAGGGNSIRGFKLDMVGPYDPYLEKAEGGEALFIMNQELRFPIYKWIRGVAFYDMGNVYKNLSDFNPFDARYSIGFGIRLDTPISIIRLDYGINLFPRLDEPRGILFFSLGQAF